MTVEELRDFLNCLIEEGKEEETVIINAKMVKAEEIFILSPAVMCLSNSELEKFNIKIS